MPLEFVRTKQALQWNNGTRLSIPGTWVDSGTLPAKSTWAMNPVSQRARARPCLPCTAADAAAQCPQIPRIDFAASGSGQPKGGGSAAGCHQVHKPIDGTTVIGKTCRQFDPPCNFDGVIRDAGWVSQDPANMADVAGECSGDWLGGRIVDEVVIPKGLEGDYVLGFRWAPLRPLFLVFSLLLTACPCFRWDCEESTQVWSSCADVTITK